MLMLDSQNCGLAGVVWSLVADEYWHLLLIDNTLICSGCKLESN